MLFIFCLHRIGFCAGPYYVATDGDDGRDGTSVETAFLHHPWDDAAIGVSKTVSLSAGETVYFLDGIHTVAIDVRQGGNVDNPITISSLNGAENCVLQSNGSDYVIVNYRADTDYVKVADLTLDGNGYTYVVYYQNRTGTEIENCFVRNWSNAGIYGFGNTSDKIVGCGIFNYGQGIRGIYAREHVLTGGEYAHNRIHGIGISGTALGGIQIYDTDIPSMITENEIFDCGESGILLVAADNQIIHGNTVYNNKSGIFLQSSDKNLIEHNTIYNNWTGYEYPHPEAGGSGIRWTTSSENNTVRYNCLYDNYVNINYAAQTGNGGDVISYNLSTDARINECHITGAVNAGHAHIRVVNNTFVHSRHLSGHCVQIQCNTVAGRNAIIANNIMVTTVETTQGIFGVNDLINDVRIDNNLVYDASGGSAVLYNMSTTEYRDVEEWKAAIQGTTGYAANIGDLNGISENAGANELDINPFIVNMPAGDYALKSYSPCRNAGQNAVWMGMPSISDMAHLPITNESGAIVAFGGVVDIGAYEYFPYDDDGDGIPNEEEFEIYGTNPNIADTDGDGLPDGEELAYWGEDWSVDYDGDGGNNLIDPDADDDGFRDGDEVFAGTDPSDPISFPSTASVPAISSLGVIILVIVIIIVGLFPIKTGRRCYGKRNYNS